MNKQILTQNYLTNKLLRMVHISMRRYKIKITKFINPHKIFNFKMKFLMKIALKKVFWNKKKIKFNSLNMFKPFLIFLKTSSQVVLIFIKIQIINLQFSMQLSQSKMKWLLILSNKLTVTLIHKHLYFIQQLINQLKN